MKCFHSRVLYIPKYFMGNGIYVWAEVKSIHTDSHKQKYSDFHFNETKNDHIAYNVL